jgi:hypothetical protein
MPRIAFSIFRRSFDIEDEKVRLKELRDKYHDENGKDKLVVIIFSGTEPNVLTFPGDNFTVPDTAYYVEA